MTKYQLQTRVELLHFSLSNCKDALLAVKLKRAIAVAEAQLEALK